uniref:Uncharacterized protein n=1 Tax=Aquila chrysaetos chrysaetos TaxID=223781 RepID=A0A663EG88_AQUCH
MEEPLAVLPRARAAARLSVVVVPAALYALGFTKAGITVGSVAARMMSLAARANGGGVAAESLVAIAQSLGECSQWGARGVTTGGPVFWPPWAVPAAWREPGVVAGAGTPPAGIPPALGWPRWLCWPGGREVRSGGGLLLLGVLPQANGAQWGPHAGAGVGSGRGGGARADFSSSSSGAAGVPTAVKVALLAIGAAIGLAVTALL